MRLIYGKDNQVSFRSINEKYAFIGYLTEHDVGILWENNDQQGAWGKEGRITFATDDVKAHFPDLGYSAGVQGSYSSRLNCNEFVKELFNLGFVKGKEQDISVIRDNVKETYQPDFDRGRGL